MTRLILIGASGLDWASFATRLKAKTLPNLESLRRRGGSGWLMGAPNSSELASWGSLASGVQPEQHGVYCLQEAWAGGLRPTGRASWRTPPLWALLDQAGVTTGSVAWPACRHGADWGGVHIDESFAAATGPNRTQWALPLHCAPKAIREPLRERRIHPRDITAPMLAPLVPGLASIDQTRDARLPMIAVAMARAASIQAAATWMVTEVAPEALFIHQPWLGEIRARFAGLQDPKFADVVDGAWRFLDALIGGLIAQANADAAIMLVSPGERGKPGVVVAGGGNIITDASFEGGNLLDIAPTVLGAFGLRKPELPGRPLALLKRAQPYRDIAAAPASAAVEADLQLMQIVSEAGYTAPRLPTPSWRAQGLTDLGVIVLDRAPEIAKHLTEAALQLQPDNATALAVRAMALVSLEEVEALPDLADALDKAAPARAGGALARGAYHVLRGEIGEATPWLAKAEADADPETGLRVAALWFSASRFVNAEQAFQNVLKRSPTSASAEIGLSMTAMARHDYLAAEAALQRALKQDPGRAAIYVQLAHLYKRTSRHAQAASVSAIAKRLGASATFLEGNQAL